MKAKGLIWIFFDREAQRKTKPLTLVDAQMLVLGLKNNQIARFFVWTPGWTQWSKLEEFLDTDQKFFAIAPTKISSKSQKNSRSAEFTNVTKTTKSGTSATIFISDSNSVLTNIQEKRISKKNKSESDPQNTSNVEIDYEIFDFHGDHLKMQSSAGPKKSITKLSEKRRDLRLDYAFEVVLVSKNGKSFRSTSLNISMGGTFLENPIPREFLGKPFDLIIINKFETDPKKNRLLFKGRVVGDINDPRRLSFVDPAKETSDRLQELLLMFPDLSEMSQKAKNKKTGS